MALIDELLGSRAAALGRGQSDARRMKLGARRYPAKNLASDEIRGRTGQTRLAAIGHLTAGGGRADDRTAMDRCAGMMLHMVACGRLTGIAASDIGRGRRGDSREQDGPCQKQRYQPTGSAHANLSMIGDAGSPA